MKQSDLVQGREYMIGRSNSGQFCHYIRVTTADFDRPTEPTKAVFVGMIETSVGLRNIFYSNKLGAYWMYSARMIDYVEEIPKYFLLLGEFEWCEDSDSYIIHDIKKVLTFDSYDEAETRGEQELDRDEYGMYIITSSGERISFS